MLPVGAVDAAPPLGAADGVFDEAGVVFAGDVAFEDEGPAELFGFGLVARGFYELAEAAVGDGVNIDVEGVERDLAHGAFAILREAGVSVCAHAEDAAGELDHAGRGAGLGAATGRGIGAGECLDAGGGGLSGGAAGFFLRRGGGVGLGHAGWISFEDMPDKKFTRRQGRRGP